MSCEGDTEVGARETARARQASAGVLADAPVARPPIALAGASAAFAGGVPSGALSALPPAASRAPFQQLSLFSVAVDSPLDAAVGRFLLVRAALSEASGRASAGGPRALHSASEPSFAHSQSDGARTGPRPGPLPIGNVLHSRFQFESISSVARVVL